MALTNEDLLAISNIIARQIEPLKKEVKMIRVDLLENNVIPRLNTIEECYLSTYNRYSVGADQFESVQKELEIIKEVLREHSEKLQKIS